MVGKRPKPTKTSRAERVREEVFIVSPGSRVGQQGVSITWESLLPGHEKPLK
jgi:hypothetical protein